MQIQFNTDNQVEGRDRLAQQVSAELEATLAHLADRLTRVEIHLGDVNAARAGDGDKRCMIEARPAGREPLAVTHQAATLEDAWRGAARKLRSALASMTGQETAQQKGAASIRDNENR